MLWLIINRYLMVNDVITEHSKKENPIRKCLV